jgi:hypothetical protein
MKYYFLLALIIILLANSTFLRCQEISNAEKSRVAGILAEKIKAIYPYPDISKNVVEGINETLDKGGFDNIKTYAEFASYMTSLIEGLSNDKHLDLIYNPALAKTLSSVDDSENLLADEEAEIEKWNNYGFLDLAILDGNIGYLNLSVFFDLSYAHKTAEHAMGYFANCNGLIIDLRQNGGGWDEMVTFLLSYFIDPPGPGTLRILQSTIDSSYFASYIPPAVNGDILSNIPVYILISRATASAAEAFTTNMKYLNKNVILIGETTRGAENPVDYVLIDTNFVLQTPSYKIIYSLNPYRWEGKGIEPDIAIDPEQAKEYAHKTMLKELLANCSDSVAKPKYQWAVDGLQASYDNINISALKDLTGAYGKYRVYLENSKIFLQYNGGTSRLLIPVTKEYFVVEGINYYRISFIKDHLGERMRRIFTYGDIQEIPREKPAEK